MPRNGILFNHEARSAARLRHPQDHPRLRRIKLGLQDACTSAISMPGATGAMRATTSRGMWLMLQQERRTTTCSRPAKATFVREFVEKAFAISAAAIDWRGNGVNEKGN